MKVTFLGTGTSQGIPVIACECPVCVSDDEKDQRLRTSVLIETDHRTYVIDTGPDFRQQMLRAKVKHLDAVLFTHKHKDHVAGLDDIRSFNFRQQQALPIYADLLTINGLKKEFEYIFDGTNYPGIPQVAVHEITDEPFSVFEDTFTPIPVLHHKMPVKGFRLNNFAYVTDANFISERSMQLLRGLEVLVLNALRKEKHISHFNLEEAIAVIQELNPKQAYLTHLSHLMGKHEAESVLLPPNIAFAYDGLVISV